MKNVQIIVKYKAHLTFLLLLRTTILLSYSTKNNENLHKLQVLSKLRWECLKGLFSSWSYRVQFLSKMHSSRVEFQRRMQNCTFSSFLIHGHLTTSHRWALISSTGQVRSLDPKLQVLSLIWFKPYVVLLLCDQVVTIWLQVVLLISTKTNTFSSSWTSRCSVDLFRRSSTCQFSCESQIVSIFMLSFGQLYFSLLSCSPKKSICFCLSVPQKFTTKTGQLICCLLFVFLI